MAGVMLPAMRSVVQPVIRDVLGPPMRGGGGDPSLSTQVRELFANGEQGGMYDFRSLAGLYQDAAGATPVTAVGQPVGLILDRRFGLERGVEVIPQPLDMTSDWSGSVNVTGITPSGFTTSGVGTASTTILTPGSFYEVLVEATSDAGSGMFGVFNNSGGVENPVFTSMPSAGLSGHAIFRAVSPALGIRQPGAGAVSVSQLSIREVPGNHLSQATTAARPTYTEDGALHDGVDDFLMAANEGDWTFLHDGSGGALAVSLMITDEEGSAGNKMVGTRTSSHGFRVGASNTSALPLLVNLLDANGDSVSANGPPSVRGVWVRYVGETGGEGIRGYSNFGDTPLAPVTAWNQQEPQYPLRTLTVAPGRSTSIRRMLAINRVLNADERAIVNAWLMEGVE